jgi:hypothetical protein
MQLVRGQASSTIEGYDTLLYVLDKEVDSAVLSWWKDYEIRFEKEGNCCSL